MLWGQHHVLGAEEGIRAGGKDLDLVALGGKETSAPRERPIQLRCMDLTLSGQSKSSRSSSKRSE